MKRDPNHWLSRIEALKHGDLCDVKSGADYRWYPGIVEVNGGPGYWTVLVPGYAVKRRLFCSFLSAAQQRGGFHIPPRMLEAVIALPDTALLSRLAPELRQPIIDAINRTDTIADVFSPYIEQVRCRDQVDAWPPHSTGSAVEREPFEDEVWTALWGPR